MMDYFITLIVVFCDPSPQGASLGVKRYASLEFQTAVSKFNGVSSMSRKEVLVSLAGIMLSRQVLSYEQGESFFGTLKLELGLDKIIGSREVTKAVVFE